MKIGGFNRCSFIDFPGCVSAVIFTKGCNFRCWYCHNPELALADGNCDTVTLNSILSFLESRNGMIDGVVFSGGEPTIHNDLPDVIEQVKNMGFKIKLDTNGSNPSMLRELIDRNLIDCVAMDIKAPIELYADIVEAPVNVKFVMESIRILRESSIQRIFRTTYAPTDMFPFDVSDMESLISGENLIVQPFRVPQDGKVLLKDIKNPPKSTEFNGGIPQVSDLLRV